MFKSTFSFERRGSRDHYDILIAACGYESRSSYAAQQLLTKVSHIVAYAYTGTSAFSYKENSVFYAEVGELRTPASDEQFAEFLLQDLNEGIRDRPVGAVAVDVSSFDRERLAIIVRTLDRVSARTRVDVDFLYSSAKYDSHSVNSDPAVLVNGPLKGFEGWSANPSAPVACLVGLGFENTLALAALETLEPARTVAFIAESSDARFEQRVVEDNDSLVRSNEIVNVRYAIERPFELVHQIESVVHVLSRNYRVVLVPLGPKVFALAALLVAHEYGDAVSIWRVSADEGRGEEDREAYGTISVLPVSMGSGRGS